MVAEDNQCGFVGLGFQLLQAGWNFPHGDQCGACDARDGKFLCFANVNQYQRFPRVDSALDVCRAGFYGEDRFAHESEDSAVENCLADTRELLERSGERPGHTSIVCVLPVKLRYLPDAPFPMG